jgi:hypothetical protein
MQSIGLTPKVATRNPASDHVRVVHASAMRLTTRQIAVAQAAPSPIREPSRQESIEASR